MLQAQTQALQAAQQAKTESVEGKSEESNGKNQAPPISFALPQCFMGTFVRARNFVSRVSASRFTKK